MNRSEKTYTWYFDAMKGTPDQCVHEVLQSMRDEINMTLDGRDKDGTPCSEVRTESNLCRWLYEQIVFIESLLCVKEELDNIDQ